MNYSAAELRGILLIKLKEEYVINQREKPGSDGLPCIRTCLPAGRQAAELNDLFYKTDPQVMKTCHLVDSNSPQNQNR